MRIYFKNVLCKTNCFEANAIKRKKTFEANFKFGLLRNQLLRAYSFTLFWTGLHRFLEYTIHLAEPAWLRDSYFSWDKIQIREGTESGTPYTLDCSKQEVEKDLLYSVLEEIINYFIVNTFYSRDFNFKGFLKCHIWHKLKLAFLGAFYRYRYPQTPLFVLFANQFSNQIGFLVLHVTLLLSQRQNQKHESWHRAG